MIDIHTHLHPPRLFAAIRRWFGERTEWDLSWQPTEPDDVAAHLRAAGVERFVFFSYAHKPGMARGINAWLTATAVGLGRYGVPLGTVHLDDATYLDDARRALDDGCAGFKIHEDVQRLALDDPRFDPVFELVVERHGIVVAHVGPIPWRYEAGPGIERVLRVLERRPQLRLIVAHLGAPDTVAYFDAMDANPNLHLDTTMALAAGSPMPVRLAAGLVRAHADRVLYGTDFPNVPYPYERERAGIDALGLDAATVEAVLRGNAARLLAAHL